MQVLLLVGVFKWAVKKRRVQYCGPSGQGNQQIILIFKYSLIKWGEWAWETAVPCPAGPV